MRVAVSGAHATGKSTLIAELRLHLLDHLVVEEVYHALLDEGQLFGQSPTAEDFEVQLERSCSVLATQRSRDVIFDRCPVDYLAYLAVVGGQDSLEPWFRLGLQAMKELDLIVFVPVERPDRISPGRSEFPRLRSRVDAKLRQVLLEDVWDIGVDVVTVRGSLRERTKKVISALAQHPTSNS
jgi:nicotinamide riboside kinase